MKKRKIELKALKKQNNILFSMAKRLVSCPEIKKINKILVKASKKYRSSSRELYTSDSYYFLSNYSE